MSKKVKIDKVIIDIAGKELKLSIEQAKELQEILNNTFGEEKVVRYPVYVDRYIPPYRGPYWTYTTCVSDTTTASANTATLCLTSSDSKTETQ